MKITRQRLIEIIQEELKVINESEMDIPELEGIDFDNPENSFEAPKKEDFSILDRQAVFDVAMGLGRSKGAMAELLQSKMVSKESFEEIAALYKKYQKLYKNIY